MRLNTEVNKILKKPEIHEKLVGMGAIVAGRHGRGIREVHRRPRSKRYEAIVRDSGAPKE